MFRNNFVSSSFFIVKYQKSEKRTGFEVGNLLFTVGLLFVKKYQNEFICCYYYC